MSPRILLAAAAALVGLLTAPAAQAATATCLDTATGENTCRVLIGPSAGDYPNVGKGDVAQFRRYENAYGPQDVVHLYSRARCTLTVEQRALALGDQTLFLNWKPVNPGAGAWRSAGGSNATVNRCIADMAESIKSLGKPIYLALWHEGQRDIVSGKHGDPASAGTYQGMCGKNGPGVHEKSGTASEYVTMWHSVGNRFAAAGVTNVWWVWLVNNLGCALNPTYPGDKWVDGIGVDLYGRGTDGVPDWESKVNGVFSFWRDQAKPGRSYTSKWYAVGETGATGVTRAQKLKWFSDIATSIERNRWKALAMVMPFDNRNHETGVETRWSYDPDSTRWSGYETATKSMIERIRKASR